MCCCTGNAFRLVHRNLSETEPGHKEKNVCSAEVVKSRIQTSNNCMKGTNLQGGEGGT